MVVTFNALQSIQAFQAGNANRERRERKNAFSEAAELYANDDFSGAATTLAQHDPMMSMQMTDMGRQRSEAAAQQEKAARTEQLTQAASLTENMLQIPEAQRGEWLMNNWQQFAPHFNNMEFMDFWQQSQGDVSDATLQQELGAIRAQLGVGPPEQPESYTLPPGSVRYGGNNQVVASNPKTSGPQSPIGKIMADREAGLISQEQADAAIARANAARAPLVQVNDPNSLPSKDNLSPLQLRMDNAYADLLVDWNIGGQGDAVKQLDQLNQVLDVLESDQDVSGYIIGSMPDWMLAGINPQAMNTKELVQEVVQRSLRETLGAQFTEREGTMLLERAYNPRLDEKQNAQRVRRLIQMINARAEQLNSLNTYMQTNGTAAGWDGTLKSANEILSELDGLEYGRTQKRRRWNQQTGQMEDAS